MSAAEKMRVLAVDDEEFNLEILARHLKKAGYEAIAMEDGEKAWDYMQQSPKNIDIVLLDKMMPRVNGIEILQRMKKHPELKEIPVILQTASVGVQEVTEGIQSGAYYYLTKPFASEMLISIVNAAAREHRQKSDLVTKLNQNKQILDLLKDAHFEVSSTDEARSISAFLANCFPNPSRAIIGISALIVNAVEHGNLDIGYARKAELLAEGKFDEEVKKRLEIPENKKKRVKIHFERKPVDMCVTIKDEGKGFNFKQYMSFDPVRITDPNGRGIAMASIVKGSKIEYKGAGNEVIYSVNVNQAVS